MADWPSPPGGPADLEHVGRAAAASHHALRSSIEEVRRRLAVAAGGDARGRRLVAEFESFAAFLDRHMTLETHLLWPALSALAAAARLHQPRPAVPFATMIHPVRLLEGEHLRLCEGLTRLRAAAHAVGGEISAEAWRSARETLAALESILAEHVRFEQDVVFQLALDVERQLS